MKFTGFSAAVVAVAIMTTPISVVAAEQANQPRVQRASDLQSETAHEGKRCSFTKMEVIVTAVGWVLGGIPGAILTGVSCKKDLFQ